MDLSSVSASTGYSGTALKPTSPIAQSTQQRALLDAASVVNAAQVFGSDNEITFRVDPKARQVVVRIVNSKTGELVNQIPQEYLLRMAEEVNGK